MLCYARRLRADLAVKERAAVDNMRQEDQAAADRDVIVAAERKAKLEAAWDKQASALRASRRDDSQRQAKRGTYSEIAQASPLAKLCGPF